MLPNFLKNSTMKKIVLKEPFNVVYEGRVLNRIIKVFEIHLLRNGKPYKILGKDVTTPKVQAAPYDFEYLDFVSRRQIEKIVLENELEQRSGNLDIRRVKLFSTGIDGNETIIHEYPYQEGVWLPTIGNIFRKDSGIGGMYVVTSVVYHKEEKTALVECEKLHTIEEPENDLYNAKNIVVKCEKIQAD